MRLLVYTLLAALVGLAASQSLVLVGGGLTDGNAVVWDKVVELAGGRGVARIGIFTTASADPIGAADYYVDMFVNVYGAASATFIPVIENSNNADDSTIADLVKQQTGFFFGGGDQLRILTALRPNGRDTLVLTALRDKLKAGAMIGGTSAGTACQSAAVMITSGSSWDALTYGAFSGGPKPLYPNDLTYDEKGGLGFLTAGWVIDTHFSERGRESRLIRLLQDTRNRDIGTTRGFGVDEDMALVITNLYTQPTGKVVGTSGGVFFADVANTVVFPSSNTHYEGVITHYLTEDDSIDLTTGSITFASWKSALKGQEYYLNADVSADILSSLLSRRWAVIADQFFDNRRDNTVVHTSWEKNPQYEVTFDRTSGAGYGGNFPSNPAKFVVSYKNLVIGIRDNKIIG